MLQTSENPNLRRIVPATDISIPIMVSDILCEKVIYVISFDHSKPDVAMFRNKKGNNENYYKQNKFLQILLCIRNSHNA